MDKKVTICDSRKLKAYLRRREFCGAGVYIAWPKLSQETARLLNDKGFKNISLFGSQAGQRDKFIREYIEFIGFLGKSNNARWWWATDIASKNRFTSRMPRLIQFFLTVAQIVKAGIYKELLIIDLPWTAVDSLNKLFCDSRIPLKPIDIRRRKQAGFIYGFLRRLSVVFYNIVKIYSRALLIRWKLKGKINRELSCNLPMYIIKTFIYDHSFTAAGRYQDVFFGHLPDFVKNKKKVLIYACILGNYRYCVQKIRECVDNVIVPIEACLSLKDILSAAGEFLLVRPQVKGGGNFFGYDLKDMVNNEFIRSSGGIQFYHFIHYWSVKNLLGKVSAETFLSTYENNPWERMCVLAVREKSPRTKIIGYQHTVVPQSSVNMFISSYEKDLGIAPDKVLTVGDAPRRIMERYGNYDRGKIETACGLRFKYLFNSLVAKSAKTGNILLALEGIFEVYKLVNYVIKELKDNKQYRVIIRTHPVLPVEAFKHKLIYSFEKLSNFEVSYGRTLQEDIARADIVIYWGTTVALEALNVGKPVIHFDNGSILSYDPLFECDYLKWRVSEENNLLSVIEEINALSEERFSFLQNKAKDYMSRYFYPVTEKALKEFLN